MYMYGVASKQMSGSKLSYRRLLIVWLCEVIFVDCYSTQKNMFTNDQCADPKPRPWRHNDDGDNDVTTTTTTTTTTTKIPSLRQTNVIHLLDFLLRCSDVTVIHLLLKHTRWHYDYIVWCTNRIQVPFLINTRHKYETRGFYLFIVISSSESGD